MTDRELIERLLFLAQTAVDQALDVYYDDPEDYFIYRELRELKAAALAQPEPQGPTDEEILRCAQKHSVAYTFVGGEVIYGIVEGYDIRDDVLKYARDLLARWGRPTIEPVAQPEMVNCHWDGPPPAPHTSVSDWFNEEGSKGILRGLRISPLPSRGGPRQGCQVGGKQ